MEDCMRKLALWHTKTFKPIMIHEELEPIMAKLGFVGLPVSSSSSPPIATSVSVSPSSSSNISWKEYYFTAGGSRNPWLLFTSVNLISPIIFHVRGMPLHRVHDRPFDKKFRLISDDEVFYVYREEGTLDPATAATLFPPSNSKINNNIENNTMDHRLVLLKDINHIIGISSHTIVS
ncbi:hypothetical protein MKX01_028280 [Papaver californicum]|nr:hypothetical protein MKX01_038282 [Papaver californicum]KAI3992822.1 hypothetical protein MKX01_028280 [Papaver californicum]